MNNVINLVSQVKTTDEDGYTSVESESLREVFCEVNSVKESEFYKAMAEGINLEVVFKIYFAEFQGEEVAIFNGIRYRIVRTYQKPTDELLELHCATVGA